MSVTTAATMTFGALRDELSGFRQHLEARNRSPRTIESYAESVGQLVDYLAVQGMPATAEGVRREHVEAFLVDLGKRGRSEATVALRYRSLRVFFNYLVSDDEIAESPMRKMAAPKVTTVPVDTLSDDQARAILAACVGADFDAKRDRALFRLFVDSGARLSELANARIADVDFANDVIHVTGKGGDGRAIPFGIKARDELRRYLRARGKHRAAALEWLWLGKRGRLEPRGVVQAMKRRAQAAGVKDFHVHRTRHTFAHQFLAGGGSETSLMRLAGWKSPTMLRRYGASLADERSPSGAESR